MTCKYTANHGGDDTSDWKILAHPLGLRNYLLSPIFLHAPLLVSSGLFSVNHI